MTGAVDNVTAIGTLVNPEVVIDAATGSEYRPTPLANEPVHGKMWTTDELYTDPGFIAGLRARGVVSLHMETAAVAAVCQERRVRWSVVRAISDRATDGSVDEEVFALNNPDGTPNLRSVISYVARHPSRIPTMVRLAREVRQATVVAAETAIAACSHT